MLYKGNFLYSVSPEKVAVAEGAYLRLTNGKVVEISEKKMTQASDEGFYDFGDRLVIPAFTDLHVHASQYGQAGLGMDFELLDWLRRLTFPREARFSDLDFAEIAYTAFAEALHRQGTLHACVYATIHPEATRLLMKILGKKGLKAYVGKVEMDQNAPKELTVPAQEALAATESIIQDFAAEKMVRPIITPRFVPTCSDELLAGLGELAKRYQLPVQSHLSENLEEVKWVQELHPESKSYAEVYQRFGLWGTTPTLMAHCIYLQPDEVKMLKESRVIAVHCPDSNCNLASGIMPAQRMLDGGISLGLASDVGACHSLSMPQTMVRAIQMSKLLRSKGEQGKQLDFAQAFYWATMGNGSFFGKVGTFLPGYAFDALVIEDELPGCHEFDLLQRLQRYIYTGDDRNIAARFVDGRRI